MVGWQRHLWNAFSQCRKKVEHKYNVSANFSCSWLESSSLVGISSSRQLLADSDYTLVASPLKLILASHGGKTEGLKVVSKPSKVEAVLRNIKLIQHAISFCNFHQ